MKCVVTCDREIEGKEIVTLGTKYRRKVSIIGRFDHIADARKCMMQTWYKYFSSADVLSEEEFEKAKTMENAHLVYALDTVSIYDFKSEIPSMDGWHGCVVMSEEEFEENYY